MKGRRWNSEKQEDLMRQLVTGKDNRASAKRLAKLEQEVMRKQRQIRENLRENRDAYWTKVAEQLENAYGSKDMKLYYKLIKELHSPSNG